MCSIGLALSAVGMGLKALGAQQKAKQQQRQAQYQQRIYENQAQLAEQRMQLELRKNDKARKDALGQGRAAIGKSGVQRAGSALEVLEDTAAEFGEEAAIIQINGTNEVNSYRHSAALSRWQSGQIASASQASAGLGLIAGGVNAAGTYFTSREPKDA